MLVFYVISACVCVCLIVALVGCLCWKDRTPNNEWLGVDGMVTQKNPDENVNHLPSATPCSNGVSNGEAADKRNTISNSRRSLPDIPSELGAVAAWDVNGDNSSEHYATLGEKQLPAKGGSQAVRSSVSQHSSMSQADDAFSPYERVKYDKIKGREHPYAQVQPPATRTVNTTFEERRVSVEERTTLLRSDVPSTLAATTTPTRSRRSSAHSTEPADIPAATAVAGGIAASYELPYMTPPINFSGDSQDSSKGYTSISVREPLANILAQTNVGNGKQKMKMDVHYSTVSDDSDDVYTTIPDPNNPIYTSESETYARIPPLPITVEAEINAVPIDRNNDEIEDIDELYEAPPPPPAPPNVDSLKHVTTSSHSHTHSRQASSSSSGNFGSPKPEKRQANSPLPPPPPSSTADFHLDKSQVKRNLDDLYAKVQKNRKDDVTDDGSAQDRGNSLTNPAPSHVEIEHSYETLKKNSTTNSDFGYEKIKGGGLDCEPGYASINGPDSLTTSSDPGYEALQHAPAAGSSNPNNYEELRQATLAGYSVVNKSKKLPPPQTYDDPIYAASKSSGSESDPNYESVKERSDPNYETVEDLNNESGANNRTKTEVKRSGSVNSSSNSASRTSDIEPPYERLRNDDSDVVPGYDKVGSGGSGSSGNDADPIRSEGSEDAVDIHDENAVVQV